MDPNLQALMKKLGEAVGESLNDSEKINNAISEIKKAGFGVALIVEVTIGFKPLDPNNNDDDEEEDGAEESTPAEGTIAQRFSWNTDDDDLLREMNIIPPSDEKG